MSLRSFYFPVTLLSISLFGAVSEFSLLKGHTCCEMWGWPYRRKEIRVESWGEGGGYVGPGFAGPGSM